MTGLRCRKTNIKRVVGERLGRKVSVGKLQIGAQHFTYPGNHGHRNFRHLQGGIFHPLLQNRKEYMYGRFGNNGLAHCR